MNSDNGRLFILRTFPKLVIRAETCRCLADADKVHENTLNIF
jgi:hypothetical protein